MFNGLRQRLYHKPHWAIAVTASVFISLIPALVLAIADPDTINIEDVRAYDSVLETDDLLVVVEYNLAYSSIPTDLISDVYIGRFRQGTSEFHAVEPLGFNDRGYGRGIFSFYWSAAQKAADSIEFDDPNAEIYTITLQGKPGPFPGSVPTTTTETIQWQDKNDTQDLLHAHIKALAQKFERDAGWRDNTDFDDLIESPGGITQLTSTGVGSGEEYFSNAIPQLQSMLPSIFSSGVSTPDYTETVHDRDFQETIDSFWDGNVLDDRFEFLASTFRVPKRVFTTVFALFFMGLICYALARLLDNTTVGWQFGVLTMAVTLPMAAAVNLIPFQIAITVAFLCVLGLGWTFFLRRAGN